MALSAETGGIDGQHRCYYTWSNRHTMEGISICYPIVYTNSNFTNSLQIYGKFSPRVYSQYSVIFDVNCWSTVRVYRVFRYSVGAKLCLTASDCDNISRITTCHTTRSGTNTVGTNTIPSPRTDAMHASQRLCPLKWSNFYSFFFFCISDIKSVSFQHKSKPAVAVSCYTNVHRTLLAIHQCVSNPHYIHSRRNHSKITFDHHIWMCLSAWIYWGLGLNHSLNLVWPNIVLFHMKNPT